MILFLIRRRARKLTNRANQQITRTNVLLDARGTEMDPPDRAEIEMRLEHAADLGHGLNERPRLRQARLFRDWADETLQIMKDKLPPDSQIQTRPRRKRINS
jgi:hypothetical protein